MTSYRPSLRGNAPPDRRELQGELGRLGSVLDPRPSPARAQRIELRGDVAKLSPLALLRGQPVSDQYLEVEPIDGARSVAGMAAPPPGYSGTITIVNPSQLYLLHLQTNSSLVGRRELFRLPNGERLTLQPSACVTLRYQHSESVWIATSHSAYPDDRVAINWEGTQNFLGATNFSALATFNAGATVAAGGLDINGGGLDVNAGGIDINAGGIDVTGSSIFRNAVEFDAQVDFDADVDFNSTTSFLGNMTISGNITSNGDATWNGDIDFNSIVDLTDATVIGLPSADPSSTKTESDDFCHLSGNVTINTTVNSAITELSWCHFTNTSSGGLLLVTPEANRPGVLTVAISANNVLAAGYRGDIGAPTAGRFLLFNQLQSVSFDARFSRVTNMGLRLGVMSDVGTSSSNILTGSSWSGAIFVAHTTTFGDGDLRAVTSDGTGATVTNLGAMSGLSMTGFRRYSITQTSVGTVVYQIDGVTVATHSTNVPGSAGVNPCWYLLNRVASNITMSLDLYQLTSHTLSR